jgi:hypothetical protein
MGHKDLGGKTMLNILDALWGGHKSIPLKPNKWVTTPFNNDWPSSLLMSQDPVAIDAVGCDFLKEEYQSANGYGDDYIHPNSKEGADDYIMQAASSTCWPTTWNGHAFAGYDPENDGTVIGSLGVYDRWNNPTDKLYSKNLNPALTNGLELVKIAPEGRQVVFAVNCGGGLYTAVDGTVYHADINYTGGNVATNNGTISGTSDQFLYQSERWGNVSYAIPGLASGTYSIRFRFADPWWSTANQRVFDVTVENQTVISKLDVIGAVGKSAAYDVYKTVNVTDGTLNISFTNATVDNPDICAIEVSRITSTVNQAPVSNAGADQSVLVNNKVTLDGRASSDPDNGPSALSYSWTQIGGTTVSLTGATTSQPYFTPSATGSYTFRLTVSDGALTSYDDVVITVSSNVTYISLPGRIEAENYKAGGEAVGYHDLTAGNSGNAYKTDNVDIEATTDGGSGYNVGWIDAGEWLAYDVNVTSAGTYTLTARVASLNAGTKTLSVAVDGATVATINTTTALGWQSFENAIVGNVSLSTGTHVLRINMTTGGHNLNYLDVQKSGNLAPVSNAGADQSVLVNNKVTLDGRGSSDPDNGPSALSYSWTQIGGTTVSLTGATTSQPYFTPSATGNYTFRLTVSDGALTSYDDVVITVTSVITNLLANGDFSNGLTSWNPVWLSPAAGSTVIDAGSVKQVISATGVNIWDIQFFQDVALTAGKTYTLTFDLKSEVTAKNFKIIIEHDGDPWTKYKEQVLQFTQAANTTQKFTVSWTQSASDAGVKIGFHFGTYGTDDVWLDNVVLK